MVTREVGKQRAMLKHAETEFTERHGRQRRVQRANEVFVEPLCLLDLKTDSFDRFKLFLREVNDEPDT